MEYTFAALSEHFRQDDPDMLLAPLANLSDADAKTLIEELVRQDRGLENQCLGILSYLRPKLHCLIDIWTGGNYSDIREGQDNDTLDEETRRIISDFFTHWDLLPLPDRDFIHYSKDDIWNRLEIGDSMALTSFMSCSPHDWSHLSNGPARLRFRPTSRARYLGTLTNESGEREVLIRPGSEFVVEAIHQEIVHLREA
ncbi:hypothetical protein [Pseudomonas sp. TE50-2]|uniref:hypothetical protein n=1 Tax=Pseudomonas sp. TE50-2 TaxID=3142707 RepID=UPI0034675849